VYDDLVDGKDNPVDVSKVDVSMNGFELQDREFIAAIKEGREPNASVDQLMQTMEIMHEAEQQMNAAG
jgi:2-hydroxy-4-carboxymuconate semialdehyde hemiacetal dehydrogenase